MLNELDAIYEGAPLPTPALTISSSVAEVKRAYMKAIRCVHPDKVESSATVERKLKASAVFGVLNAAFERKRSVS